MKMYQIFDDVEDVFINKGISYDEDDDKEDGHGNEVNESDVEEKNGNEDNPVKIESLDIWDSLPGTKL